MNSGIIPARSLGSAAAAVMFVCIAAIFLAAPARAQQAEDTNVVNSMLGFFGMQFDKDEDAIDYRARAPIVVPPHNNLPQPQTAARDSSWPKDPDVVTARRKALDSKQPAPQITPNTRAELSQAELQQGKGPLPADGPPDECQASADTPLCLYAPLKALKAVTNGFKQEDARLGAEPDRKYLTEPPPGYRKPAGDGIVRANTTPLKDQPDAGDAQAYVRSQQHKTSVDE